MKTEPDAATPRETPQETFCMECPLHLTMEHIAHVAVQQHVLYLEGECQPRADLLQRLEAWSSLHAFIRSRVCVASRATVSTPDELDYRLDALLPLLPDSAAVLHRSNLRKVLTTCAQAYSCPLGVKPRE